MSWWNLSQCFRHWLRWDLLGKKSRCDSVTWIFRLILHPIALYEDNRPCTTSWYFSALCFPKKSLQILLNDNHAFLPVSFRSSSNCLSCISPLIWGPINIPSLIFASLTFWELIPHIFESTAGFIHTFHRAFHEAQLYVQRGQVHFLRKNKRNTDDIFLSWRQWCSFRPQFICIVILLVPAVPLAQETAVFCVPELHSEWQCHNLDITT